jgi:hypothetical protein
MVNALSFFHTISHKGLELNITALNIDDLHLHEQVIPAFLNKLEQSIKDSGYIRDPVIVDLESLVVLDGTHRVTALKKIGCKWVPACLVNYKNPAITVGSWYRTLNGVEGIEGILKKITKMGFDTKEVREIDVTKIGISPVIAAIKSWKESFIVCSPFGDLLEAFDIIRRIEEQIRLSALNIEYETESDALRKLQTRSVDMVFLIPKVQKDLIVRNALFGRVFPHKTTRQIVPARILHLNIPLILLKDSKRSHFEINEELKQIFKKRALKHVAAGSVINGRRYEEDVYLFDN